MRPQNGIGVVCDMQDKQRHSNTTSKPNAEMRMRLHRSHQCRMNLTHVGDSIRGPLHCLQPRLLFADPRPPPAAWPFPLRLDCLVLVRSISHITCRCGSCDRVSAATNDSLALLSRPSLTCGIGKSVIHQLNTRQSLAPRPWMVCATSCVVE